MSLSKSSDLERVADAARSPKWQLSVTTGVIVCETDSGVPGIPWTIVARRGGRGMRVSLYQPGDDTTIEGVVLGELTGAARDMGRQLRRLLEDTELRTL